MYDIAVIGAGHAGCEAALAAARMGTSVLLLNITLDTVAQLSCNPAIGGLAKGQLVKEISALGGEMGRVTDKAALQFRELNRSKGPAVRAPRAQVGRQAYPKLMQEVITSTPNLTLAAGAVSDITKDGDVFTLKTAGGEKHTCSKVIVTTGTFLNGLIHIGEFREEAGRMGEPPSKGLTESLQAFGLKTGRLKTGTPARIDCTTLDYDKLERQDGDEEIKPFSVYDEFVPYEQLPCWITYTNPETHRIISDNFDVAPLFSGQIQSTGPRYCPSVETKIHNFPDRPRHQVFLEPEDRDSDEMYCNGISTSLPEKVQEDFIHTIAGMENVKINRYGYAIEYDYIPPYQLKATLETQAVPGLYCAGQINGTSGYEEAGAQGLVAGINAVLSLREEERFVPKRYEAYIGVLIDDLITKDIEEPYRMFTSLAEYRLQLRQDNADLRLAHYAHRFGLITQEQFDTVQRIKDRIEETVEYCIQTWHEGKQLSSIICQPGKTFEDLENLKPELKNRNIEGRVREQAEMELRYSGYRKRQQKKIEHYEKRERVRIPENINYDEIDTIKIEARQKLARIRPETLGQASRIAGVSPADISILTVYLHSRNR